MNKLTRYLLLLFGCIALLIIAAIVVVPMVFNPNDYKEQIIAQVQKQTGRELSLPGNISLQVFPWLALDVGETTLANAAGFSSTPQVALKHLQARVKLLPLLRKRIEVGKVAVEGLTLSLERDRQGRNNWDDIIQRLAGEKAADKTPDSANSDAKALPDLSVDGLQLADAKISWDNQQAGDHYSLDGLNIQTGKILLDQPIDLTLSTRLDAPKYATHADLTLKTVAELHPSTQQFSVTISDLLTKLQSKTLPKGAVDVHLSAKLDADLQRQVAKVQGLALDAGGIKVTGDAQVQEFKTANPKATYKVNARADDVAPLIKAAANILAPSALIQSLSQLTFNIVAEGTEQRARLAPLQLEAALEPAGGKSLSAILKTTSVDVDLTQKTLANLQAGSLAVASDDIVPLLKAVKPGLSQLDKAAIALHVDSAFKGSPNLLTLQPLQVKTTLSGLPGQTQPEDITLSTRAEVDLPQQSAGLKDMVLQGMGLNLKAALNATAIRTAPVIKGTIDLAPFDARRLVGRLGQALPVMADSKALTRVGLNTSLTATKDSAALSELAVQLDDATIKGRIAVSQFAKPVIEYALAIDSLNADRYLPPTPDSKAAAPAKPAPKNDIAPPTPLPVGMLRKLNVRGPLSIGKLKIAKATLTDIRITLAAAGGLVKVTPISAGLYQGKFSGDMTLDARNDPLKLLVNESLTGVQVEPLLTDFSGTPSKLAGTTEFKSQLNASGTDVPGLKKNLNGAGNFAFRNGSVKGINLVKLVCDVASKALGDGAITAGDVAGLLNANATSKKDERTEFTELTGTFAAQQGVVGNNDLEAKSPLLRVGGKGNVNLVANAIDYTLATELVGSCQGQGGQGRDDLKGITIPIKITGPLNQPKLGIDLESLLKAKAQKLLDRQTDKLQKQLQDKLPPATKGIQDKLKGILKF